MLKLIVGNGSHVIKLSKYWLCCIACCTLLMVKAMQCVHAHGVRMCSSELLYGSTHPSVFAIRIHACVLTLVHSW